MNLKEEIKRIKSLFTEERLFGNLVEVSNPDTDGDGKISSSEFADAGNEINVNDAKEFIVKSGNVMVLDQKNCDTTVSSTPHLQCIKEALDDNSSLKDDYQLFYQGATIGCAFQITRINAILDFDSLSTKITGDYSPSNTKLTITFWEKGRFKGETKTYAILLEFDNKLTTITGIGGKNFEDVKWLRLRGGYNDTCQINNMYVDQVSSKGGKENLDKDNKFLSFGDIDTVEKLLGKIQK